MVTTRNLFVCSQDFYQLFDLDAKNPDNTDSLCIKHGHAGIHLYMKCSSSKELISHFINKIFLSNISSLQPGLIFIDSKLTADPTDTSTSYKGRLIINSIHLRSSLLKNVVASPWFIKNTPWGAGRDFINTGRQEVRAHGQDSYCNLDMQFLYGKCNNTSQARLCSQMVTVCPVPGL